MKKEKHILFLLIASAGVILLLTGISLFSNKNKKKSTVPQSATRKPTVSLKQEDGEPRASALFLVMSTDTKKEQMTLHGFLSEGETTYSYGTVTEFRDKYGTLSSAYSFQMGDLVKAEYNKENVLLKVTRSSEHFELHGVEDFSISSAAIKINGVNYHLSENTVVYDADGIISLPEVKELDRINVWGLGSEVYAIRVMKGHGSIKLINSEKFQDAKVMFGGESYTLTGEPSYLVREGTYQVTVAGEENSATVSVTVAKNEQMIIDLYEYGGKPVETASVRFHVTPFASVLTIDGEKQDYFEKDLTLSYGEHKVVAEMGGYVTYQANINISKAYQTFYIDLVERKPAVTDPEPGETDPETGGETQTGETGPETGGETETGETGPETGDETETGETDPETGGEIDPESSLTLRDLTGIGAALGMTCDENNSTYLLLPVGAKVMLDGVSIGEVPLKFEKIIGSYEITISKDGKTKDFSVTGKDDGENAFLRLSFD